MHDYNPPVKDMMFVLDKVVGLDGLPQMDVFGADDVLLILDSAAQLASQVIAPLNKSADDEGNTLTADCEVITPKGFKEAYAEYRDGGWNSVPFSQEHGGQGLPYPIGFAIQEMWQAANMSFGLCPLLNQGAVEAIENHGTNEQKATYLEKLISGVWTGTMNLTEPQAGTDLGAIKTKAKKQDDGTYLIKGQKIFITYGEHDLAENIIHLVLAKVPDAPEGTKGISMFVVPKFLPDENGNVGKRNDVKCVSIEHKLGIHASPTCTMQYGDEGGAVGFLIGEENEGLKYMFTMMNNARLSVGLQGVAISDRAYQAALAYAKERVQGTHIDDKSGEKVVIIEHPDVKRMLLRMKALTEAGRALTYEAARALDKARLGDEEAKEEVDLLTPVVKAWCTDRSIEIVSLGVQVFAGMGFVEETGAAQYYRDARILPIYEGANGIHALDLSMRKILMDQGVRSRKWLEKCARHLDIYKDVCGEDEIFQSVHGAVKDLEGAVQHILDLGQKNSLAAVAAINEPFLQAFGYIAGGVMMLRMSARAQKLLNLDPDPFYEQKTKTARFYVTHVMPSCLACLETVRKGSEAVTDYQTKEFN